jgi:hypothetical protein
LSYNITDADASLYGGRLITVSTAPHELHIYDPVGQGDQIVPLPLPPFAVSVSSDGNFAAVGHDGWISYINLSAAAIVATYPIASDIHHVLFGGSGFSSTGYPANNGYIYGFPQSETSDIYSLNISSGTVTPTAAAYTGRIPRRDGYDHYFYLGDSTGTSKWDISQGVPELVESTTNLAGCANYWVSEFYFSSCGKVYFTSDTIGQDLQPAGSFPGLSSVEWVADSDLAAVIPAAAPSSLNDTEIQFFNNTNFSYSYSLPIPYLDIAGKSYPAHGTSLFWSQGLLITIATVDSTANLASNNAVFASLAETAGAGPVAITVSLSPNPMTGSNFPQTLTINGVDFEKGDAVVQLTSSGGTTTTLSGSQVTYIAPGQLQVPITPGTAASTWTVEVFSYYGGFKPVNLTITSAPTPVVSSLNPNPITGSNSAQTLTINGTGFQNGAGLEVQLTPSRGATTTLQASQITFVSASQLQVSITTGTAASSWTIQVINPSGLASAGVNLTVNAPQTAVFVTGYALGGQSPRNDFTGWVGMKLTVGANPLSVSSLGRICVANNSQVHTMKFVNASNGSDISGASAPVNMAGCTAGQFVFSSISPVALPAATSYYLVSQETQGGDQWYDQGAISATTAASVNSSVYFYGGNWIPLNSTNTSYVPPNFQYTIGGGAPYLLTTSVSPTGGGSIAANPSAVGGSYANGTVVQLTATPAAGCTFVGWSGALAGPGNPQTVTMSGPQTVTAAFQCSVAPVSTPFVTGYGLSGQSLRNDLTSWAGMKLTLGPNPLTVSSLGRLCVANNALTHTVKFVNAGDQTDVSGASASVNMAGCTPGQFVYSSISPVTLAAARSYYLVSQEIEGGDSWYDQGLISAVAVASVNSSVFSDPFGNWLTVDLTGTSYVPPNFQYLVGGNAQYLLTTNVSPPGSGSIAANPSAAGGSYASGTPVQLTATPAAGCTFVDWTGAVTGSVNPVTVTMSAAQTVTANFQCSAPPPAGTSFVTGYALSGQSLRNDFTGWVGMKLTVGANPLTVSSLGRICVANNAQTHTVKFVNAGTGSDVGGASASVSMTGCTPGQFVYSSISPVTLPAAASYYLVSQETQSGDRWYDQGSISATTDASVNNSVYFYAGNWYPVNSTNTSYVPPNFQYSTGGTAPPQYLLTTSVAPAASGSVVASPSSAGGSYASGTVVQLTATPAANCTFSSWSGSLTGTSNPQTVTMSGPQTVTANFQCSAPPPSGGTPFVTGYGLSGQSLRNDFTGWVGMKLTVGSNPLTVSSLGRICVANNALTHTVKFVNASSGSDVPGASVTVSMAGCTAGQFVYSPISPVTLPAAASYYLVSQETQGGDQWYDQGAISATTAATLNNSVYFWNGNWAPGSANTSYVPPNFLYQVSSGN